MAEKAPCRKCGVLVLPKTLERNDGQCVPCRSGRRGGIEENRRLLAAAKTAPPEPEFICVECESMSYRSEMHINRAERDPEDPWSCVTQVVECWDCGAIMPRRLARRWGMDFSEARRIWFEVFRNDKRSHVNANRDA